MEKKKSHYSLSAIKALIERDGLMVFTATARSGFMGMGLSATEALAVMASLSAGMLFKSMTTHADNKLWQDVYHAPCPNGKTAYIKMTMQSGAVVIQFKEK
ncbi:type II toxin-antitoxin system MqsR family toxin [Propionivibrio sp.]|uniref:type II toxin-antitoxin system MqsR family toxin n=1 Tax=Propionivibrio sp. TaxID=2212460 RepID=UPI003BF2B9C3